MKLTDSVLKQFAQITAPKKEKKDTFHYGTAVVDGERTYVILDGSTIMTPVSTTVAVNSLDRVTVLIKDHAAVITGNISVPSDSAQGIIDDALERIDGDIDALAEATDQAIERTAEDAQEAVNEVKRSISNIANIIYPVGTVYETRDDSFDPNTSFGGTWEDITRSRIYATGSKELTTTANHNLVTITLQPNTKYLIFGHESTNSGSSLISMAQLIVTGANDYVTYYGRTEVSSGQGTHAIGWVETGDATATVTLQCYRYGTVNYTATGRLMAIPLGDDGYSKRWLRTA